MKKILSTLLISTSAFNITESSFAMDMPGWVNGTNCTTPNTCEVTQDPLTGLFELVLNNVTQVDSNSSSNPLPLPYCVPTASSGSGLWRDAEIYTATVSAVALGLSLLHVCYQIYYNSHKGPIAQLTTKVDGIINGPTSLAARTTALENDRATLTDLAALGAKQDPVKGPISLGTRLDDIEKAIKNHATDLNGDGQNKKGLKTQMNGDPSSQDAFEKQGVIEAVKSLEKKLRNYGSKEDLEKYARECITKVVAESLTSIAEKSSILSNKVHVLEEENEDLVKENEALKEQLARLEKSADEDLDKNNATITSSPKKKLYNPSLQKKKE